MRLSRNRKNFTYSVMQMSHRYYGTRPRKKRMSQIACYWWPRRSRGAIWGVLFSWPWPERANFRLAPRPESWHFLAVVQKNVFFIIPKSSYNRPKVIPHVCQNSIWITLRPSQKRLKSTNFVSKSVIIGISQWDFLCTV